MSLREEMLEPREPLLECADAVAGRSGGLKEAAVRVVSLPFEAVVWETSRLSRPLFLRKIDEEPWVLGA